jgi:NADH-quinone oxidoreductase subunit N
MIAADELLALSPLIALAGTAVLELLLIAFWRRHTAVWALALLGILASLALLPVAAELAPRPVTALLTVDRYALAFMALVGGAGLVVALLCPECLAGRTQRPEAFYPLLLTALLGAEVLAASRHFAALFLGLETLSVSLFALIAYPCQEEKALEAGIKYLVLSGMASGLLLFGMALVYSGTGSLEFAALAGAPGTLTVLAGTVLVLMGLGFKLSLFPLHLWAPDVYQGAPVPVSALLATVAKGAALVVLLRWALAGGLGREPVLADVLSLMAVASMLAGNLLALRQGNLKRLLAYSSIAHMGYLAILLVAGARVGGGAFAAEALLFYLAAYFPAVLAAFGVVAALGGPGAEAESLEDYQGLFYVRPWLAGVLAVALLSLAGIPLTAGFVGKFYLFVAGGKMQLWPLLAALALGSVLGLYYYLRVIFQMAKLPGLGAAVVPVPWSARWVLGALLAWLLGLGVYPGGVMEALRAAGAGF